MTKKSPSDLVSLRLAALRLRVGRATLTRIVEQRGIAPDGEHNGHPTYSLRKLRKALECQDPAQMSESERGAYYKSELLRVQLEEMCAGLILRADHEAALVEILELCIECFKGLPAKVKDKDVLPEHALVRFEEETTKAANELQQKLDEVRRVAAERTPK